MKIKDIYVIKKDGTKQSFDGEKIVRAINASAKRIGETLSAEDEERTVELVLKISMKQRYRSLPCTPLWRKP